MGINSRGWRLMSIVGEERVYKPEWFSSQVKAQAALNAMPEAERPWWYVVRDTAKAQEKK